MTGLISGMLIFAACGQNETPEKAPPTPVMTIDSVTGAPISLPNPWKNAGCDLITDDEVIDLFDIDAKRYAFNARTLPDQGFCLRSWLKPNWKELESANEKPGAPYVEFKNTMVTQVLDYGNVLVANDQFEMVRHDQRDVFGEEIAGLGDGALWSASQQSLMVKKGHLVVKITIDMADTPEENRELARTLAKLALQKMR